LGSKAQTQFDEECGHEVESTLNNLKMRTTLHLIGCKVAASLNCDVRSNHESYVASTNEKATRQQGGLLFKGE